MNAVEHIVKCYFREVEKCFVLNEVKVIGGVNRQLEILAVSLLSGDQYHIARPLAAKNDGTMKDLPLAFVGPIPRGSAPLPFAKELAATRLRRVVGRTVDNPLARPVRRISPHIRKRNSSEKDFCSLPVLRILWGAGDTVDKSDDSLTDMRRKMGPTLGDVGQRRRKRRDTDCLR